VDGYNDESARSCVIGEKDEDLEADRAGHGRGA